MSANTITLTQVKPLINYTIDNNNKRQESGEMPIALSLEASAGVGKTSVIRQIAEERGMGFTKINMAQLEEAGDIIGFPQVEYECQIANSVKDKDGTVHWKILPHTAWLNAKQMDNPQSGVKYRHTGKTRMGYAKPAWVPEYNENGNLILLDDYVRKYLN